MFAVLKDVALFVCVCVCVETAVRLHKGEMLRSYFRPIHVAAVVPQWRRFSGAVKKIISPNNESAEPHLLSKRWGGQRSGFV